MSNLFVWCDVGNRAVVNTTKSKTITRSGLAEIESSPSLKRVEAKPRSSPNESKTESRSKFFSRPSLYFN